MAPSPILPASTKQHIPILDGIRGLAALMVMWFHYFQNDLHLSGVSGQFLNRFNSVGQTGVDLFFVLSGFLITRILIADKGQPHFFVNFYARRTLRIVPLYYLGLLLYLVLQPYLSGALLPTLPDDWWWWVYLQNIPMTFGWGNHSPSHYWAVGAAHYWSLAVEEHFYLIWPLMVFYFNRRSLVFVSLFFLMFSLCVRIALLDAGVDGFAFTLTRLDSLSAGTLLAILEPLMTGKPLRFRNMFMGGFLVLIGLLSVVFLKYSGSHAYWLQAFKYPFISLCYFLFIGFVVTAQSRSLLARIFTSVSMRFIGSISYGLYIYHIVCFYWCDQMFDTAAHPLLYCALAFALTGVVAFGSFVLFEKPILQMKRYFVNLPYQ